MKYVHSIAVLFAVALIVSTSSAFAQDRDKQYKDWTVYTTQLQGKKTCYMASFPTRKSGNYKRRDEPYMLVTRMGNNTYEVSVSSGYPYKGGSDVKFEIDGKKYTLFTKGELAWANSASQDNAMVSKMKAGIRAKARGTSQLGTYSIDTYSLSGFTAAFNRINSLCN